MTKRFSLESNNPELATALERIRGHFSLSPSTEWETTLRALTRTTLCERLSFGQGSGWQASHHGSLWDVVTGRHEHTNWGALNESLLEEITEAASSSERTIERTSFQERLRVQLGEWLRHRLVPSGAEVTLAMTRPYDPLPAHIGSQLDDVQQRVERIESMLVTTLGRLEQLAASNRTALVPVESFAPEPYQLLRPFTVVVRPSADGFSADFFDANLHAYGDTEEAAVANLKSVVLDAYDRLTELAGSRLGPALATQKQVLAFHLCRKQH